MILDSHFFINYGPFSTLIHESNSYLSMKYEPFSTLSMNRINAFHEFEKSAAELQF